MCRGRHLRVLVHCTADEVNQRHSQPHKPSSNQVGEATCSGECGTRRIAVAHGPSRSTVLTWSSLSMYWCHHLNQCGGSPMQNSRFLIFLVALAPAALAMAQGISGSIQGTVMDSSANAIPDARVVARNLDTITLETRSNQVGLYFVGELRPGK